MGMVASFKIKVSEEEKAEMPSVASVRRATAEAIHTVYGEPEEGSVPSPKSEYSSVGAKVVAPSKAERRYEGAGVAAGNGKDRRQLDSEFEEF
jgi:hypothetical protein